MPSQRLARVGDTVLFRPRTGDIWPAIVLRVHDAETVDLTVFPENAPDKVQRYRHVLNWCFLEDNPVAPALPQANPVPKSDRLLMSAMNPNGMKLEDVLEKLIDELNFKNVRIDQDDPTGKAVYDNNASIILLLKRALNVQLGTLALLDSIGSDRGPTRSDAR